MNATASAEFLDLRQLIQRAWARRWWLLASTVLFTIAAVIYALSGERIYRATTVLAPQEANSQANAMASLLGQASGLAALVGINVGAQTSNVEEALAVLRSREFTMRFMNDEKIVPKIFRDDWDKGAQQWKAGVKPPTSSRAFKIFDSEMRQIVQNRKTGLVSLHIDWTSREEAARWANLLVQRLNDEMRQRAINDANVSLRYLEKELEANATVEVRQSINRLIEAQIKQRMLANVNQEYAFRVIDQAVVPEIDEAIRPQRRKIVIVGALLGMLLGGVTMVLFDYFRRELA